MLTDLFTQVFCVGWYVQAFQANYLRRKILINLRKMALIS